MPIRRTVEWFENLVDPLRLTAGPAEPSNCCNATSCFRNG